MRSADLSPASFPVIPRYVNSTYSRRARAQALAIWTLMRRERRCVLTTLSSALRFSSSKRKYSKRLARVPVAVRDIGCWLSVTEVCCQHNAYLLAVPGLAMCARL